MGKPHSSVRLGVLAMIFSTIALSAHNVLIKSLLGTYGTAEVLLYRNTIAILALTALLIFIDRSSMKIWKHSRRVQLRSILSMASWVLGIFAIKLLPLSTAVTIYATCPLFASAMAMLLRDEQYSGRRLFAILVGLVGFAVIALEALDGNALGIIVALGSSSTQAVGIVLVRRSDEASSTNVFTFNTLAILIFFSGSYVAVSDAAPLPQGSILIAFTLAGLCYLATVWFGTISYRLAPVTHIASLQNLPVIWLTIFDILVFNIDPDISFFLGAGLLIMSSAYLVSSAR